MSLPVTSTINGTSFAQAYLDATALVLDGISLIGQDRADKFGAAKRRLGDAFMYADTTEEINLVVALQKHIAIEERSGRGV